MTDVYDATELAKLQKEALDRIIAGQKTNVANATQQQQTYGDRLREKKALAEQAAGKFQERAGDALDPNSSSQLSPKDVYTAFNSLQRAMMDKIDPLQKGYDDATSSLAASNTDTTGFDALTKMLDFTTKTSEDASVVDSYVEQIRNGSLKLNGVPASARDAVVKRMSELGVDPLKVEGEAEQKQILTLINSMQNLYEGGGSGLETDPLSSGLWKGLKRKAGAKLKTDDAAQVYLDEREAMIASLKSITGDTGILTDVDAIRIKGLLPDVTDNKAAADAKWARIKTYIAARYGGAPPATAMAQSGLSSGPNTKTGGSGLDASKSVGGSATLNSNAGSTADPLGIR